TTLDPGAPQSITYPARSREKQKPRPIILLSPVPKLAAAMSAETYCQHSFTMIKSDTTLILWHCGMCHSGPHWFIFECTYCKLKTCRQCASNT
ncbi:MAG: hypothetical protein M1815_005971, partial [Lichina confinis]